MLLKKYETEQEHSSQLEAELEELSDKQQQEISDLEKKLENEKKKNAELEDSVAAKTAQVKKLKDMHKNLRRTDDRLLELKEKIEKEGDREDLEEELCTLRERVAELEEAEQNRVDEGELRKQIENEIRAIEDLENEVERLRKTALIHKQVERFVEDSMFKLDELTARHDFEEKKTSDMENQVHVMKANLSSLDEQSSKIILIEEDLRKEFRLLEEENKKTDSNSGLDNSIVAAVIKERDDLKEKYESLLVETTELQETAVQKAREQLRQTPEPEDGHVVELKQRLDDQMVTISSLEEEIKRSASEKLKVTSSNNVSQSEIKLLATEEDLEVTKTLLKKEEAKTTKQQLQVKMLKERLLKLEEIEKRYKGQVEMLRKTSKKSNQATLDETNMRRQLEDIKTVLEEEVKERQFIEKELMSTTMKLQTFETRAKPTSSIQVQTDDEPLSRPSSRFSDRFGATTPVIQVFQDTPRTHRIVPGGFRGCNYAAGMNQESLVRPSSIKQQKIRIPASQDKQINMTFVQDVTDGQSEGKSDKKCVLKITKVMDIISCFISFHLKHSTLKNITLYNKCI